MKIINLIAEGYLISYTIIYRCKTNIHKFFSLYTFNCTNNITIVYKEFKECSTLYNRIYNIKELYKLDD